MKYLVETSIVVEAQDAELAEAMMRNMFDMFIYVMGIAIEGATVRHVRPYIPDQDAIRLRREGA